MSAGTRALAGAIAQFCLALALFSCMDSIAKHLVARYPAGQIAWARYAVHLVLMSCVMWPRHGRALLAARRPGLALLRGATLAGVTLGVILTLQRLPLAEATSLFYLAPLLLVPVAGPLLGERLSASRIVALALGLAGMLLVVRPGGALDPLGVALGLVTAVANAAYQLLTRKLAPGEQPLVLLFYTALAGTLVTSALLPWSWTAPTGNWLDLLLIVSLGVLGALGHYLFSLAYRHAAATSLGPLTYLQLVFATALGFLVFGQLPDPIALAGMAVIAGAGLTVTLEGKWPLSRNA